MGPLDQDDITLAGEWISCVFFYVLKCGGLSYCSRINLLAILQRLHRENDLDKLRLLSTSGLRTLWERYNNDLRSDITQIPGSLFPSYVSQSVFQLLLCTPPSSFLLGIHHVDGAPGNFTKPEDFFGKQNLDEETFFHVVSALGPQNAKGCVKKSISGP